jgi:dolichyl-phosphate-mannose--protein O-mannosyl transferase
MNLFKSKSRIFIFLFWVGILLHFTRLSSPRSVVFDEVHFGKFVSAYCCTSSNFFDIHPPHAKLLIAAAAKIGGYKGDFDFEHISESYQDTPIFWLRLFPAIWGTLIPLVFAWLLILLGASLPTAFLGGLALTFENAFLLQTRIIALDGLLVLAILSSIAFYVSGNAQISRSKQLVFFLTAGALSGLAVGTKLTGLVSPALLIFLASTEIWGRWNFRAIGTASKKIFVMALSFVGIYLSGWWFHFFLLTKPGFGDQFYKYSGRFMTDLKNLHGIMLERNASITQRHGDSSEWWQWPTNNKPIYYWQGPDADIYFVGNSVVWWGASLLFLVAFGYFVWTLRRPRTLSTRDLWIGFGGLAFLVSYVPFIPVHRPLFLYHYLTPLVFALMTGLLWLEARFKDETTRRYVYALISLAILGGFATISGVTFGWPHTRSWSTWVLAHLAKF